jgi:hypothetical protein
MQLLRSVRSFGTERHEASPADEWFRRAYGAQPERADWQERLREAEEFFPDDWVRASRARPLAIGSADRAFHVGNRGGSGPTTLAMPTANNDSNSYVGAFRNYTHEVNVHEMGHRMEATIPGLQELEFTLVRRRSMRGDRLESLAKLNQVTRNSGYADREVTFPDDWKNPYAGKTYEDVGTIGGRPFIHDEDPGARPWEVFQVGLQDTLGRNPRYGDEELQHFVLGVLATLARSDTKPKRKRRSSR